MRLFSLEKRTLIIILIYIKGSIRAEILGSSCPQRVGQQEVVLSCSKGNSGCLVIVKQRNRLPEVMMEFI